MSILIYFILTVNTRLLNQRPKDYLLTEYLHTGFPCPISLLGQYEEEKNHSVYIKGVCGTEQVSIINESQNFKGVACTFFFLPS